MPASATEIASNIKVLRSRIDTAATNAGRAPGAIRLIAVSKRMPASSVIAAIAAGQYCFGENTVQDALGKQAQLDDPANEWHFIGHLQSNKAKAVAEHFDWLHTVDNLKLVNRLSALRPPAMPPLQILLQVNIARDPAKQGLTPDIVAEFAEQLLAADYPGIMLRGLMTIGQRDATGAERQAEFTALRDLAVDCGERLGKQYFSELSMGMSADFEAAIAAGATMIRVGTAIFGQRE